MTDDAELVPDLDSEDAFEVQMRGYSRRQVNEFVASTRSKVRTLEEDLAHSLDESERLRLELAAVRQGLAGKPAHEEISERVGQILKLADDEAKAQRSRAQEEIAQQREEAKKDADRFRTEAREQAERMLNAAQEQAENAIASARSEAEKMRNSARVETERAINEASKEAENTLAAAKSQAKQMLDEATARASAIHDGAERRLTLLTSRHTETMRRLTEIRDVVTNLVASESSRGSLEEEVAKSVANSFAAAGAGQAARPPADGRGGPQGRPGERDAVPEVGSVAATRFGQRTAASGEGARSGPEGGPHHVSGPTRPGNGAPVSAGPGGGPAGGVPGSRGTGDSTRSVPD